jgi:hypothetical protein
MSIKARAESIGHKEAVRQILDLPELSEKELKNRSLSNYILWATGMTDQFFLERCWIGAYGALLKINFKFPHIDPFICQPNKMPTKEPEQ